MPQITDRDVLGYLLEKQHFYAAGMFIAEIMIQINHIRHWKNPDQNIEGSLWQAGLASLDEMLQVCQPPLNDANVMVKRYDESENPRVFSIDLALELNEQHLDSLDYLPD
jgi:hypothetical protein